MLLLYLNNCFILFSAKIIHIYLKLLKARDRKIKNYKKGKEEERKEKMKVSFISEFH